MIRIELSEFKLLSRFKNSLTNSEINGNSATEIKIVFPRLGKITIEQSKARDE